MNKYIKSCFAIFIFISSLLLTTTFSKYSAQTYGLAWITNFIDFGTITELFVVQEDNYKYDENNNKYWQSDHLWGADENGEVKQYESEFNLGNLENISYSAYNNTSQRMLILFDVQYCAPDTSSNGAIVEWLTKGYIFFYVTNITNYSAGDTNASLPGEFVATGKNSKFNNVADVASNRTDKICYKANNMNYYLFEALINPIDIIGYYFGTFNTSWIGESFNAGNQITKEFIEDNFVLDPGETFNFNISTTYSGVLGSSNSISSCYASFKLVAIPYTN